MESTGKRDLIQWLANQCLYWSREDLIQYAYDRLYNEYWELSDGELVLVKETVITNLPEGAEPYSPRKGVEL